MKSSKRIYIVYVVIVFICLTIGYAVLNSMITISGKSNISKNICYYLENKRRCNCECK